MIKFASTVLIIALLPLNALAGIVTLSATEDTYITQHGGLGGTNSVHGADNQLYVIGSQNSGFIATTFIRFDLSGVAGTQALGNGALELYLLGGWPNATVTVSAYQSQSDWDEADSWNSIPGGAPFGAVGVIQDQVALSTLNGNEGYFSWDVSQSLIQSWLDNPSSNYGLMITSGAASSGHSDIVFASRESGNAPLLTFSVPAPAPMLLLLLGLVSIGGAIRTRSRR